MTLGLSVCEGDEHWTKVLQANDVVGKQAAVCPYHGKNLPLRCAFSGDAKSPPAGDDPVPSDRVCGRDRSFRADLRPGGVCSPTQTKERTVLTTLFDRFCQWLSETRRTSSQLRLPLPRSRSRRSSSLRCSPDGEGDVAGQSSSSSGGRRSSRRRSRRRCNSMSPSSSSHGDFNDPAMHRATSTCSSATTTGTTGSDVISSDVIEPTGSARPRVAPQRCVVTSARSGKDVSGAADCLEKDFDLCVNEECCPLVSTWPSANGNLTHTCTEQLTI